MHVRLVVSLVAFLSASVASAQPEAAAKNGDESLTSVPLTVSAGVPLRLYLTQRLPKRLDAPAHAKLLDPLFAFDREVAPAGTEVIGRVSRLKSAPKMQRITSSLNGDFTPLHTADVEFTTLLLPDGRQIAIQTVESPGLNSIFSPRPPKKSKKQKDTGQAKQPGVLGTGKQQAKDRINATVSGRTRGVADIVRGPDKRERLQEFLWSKLPYHPQWFRKGTRFDAALREPLQFGEAKVNAEALKLLGTQPPPDSVVQVRLITPLNSGTAKLGEKVEAVVSRPLFSPENRLILPEGTHMTGAVTLARRARWLHRGGQLRFNFQRIDLPPGLVRPVLAEERTLVLKTQASLQAAESSGRTGIQVDDEGGVKTKEPKTRLIAPAIAVLVATRSADDDAGRHTRHGTGEANTSGRTLGGISGFGLLGAAAAQASRTVGSALGFYGMGWSVYSNLLARGGEVEFANNDAMDVRFGARPPAAASKLRAEARTEDHVRSARLSEAPLPRR